MRVEDEHLDGWSRFGFLLALVAVCECIGWEDRFCVGFGVAFLGLFS